MKLKFWEATATLVGMIVGAGVLGLPYVVAQVGVLPGVIMLVVLGFALLILNLMFTEVILRTRFRHQVAGYAKKYLGKAVSRLEICSMLINAYGVLLAYIIGEGVALATLFDCDPFVCSLIFLIIASIILYFGLNIVKVIELWMVVGFLIIISVIFFVSGSSVELVNFSHLDLSKSFLAYGVILFAYGGVAAIVPLREVLRRNEKKVKRAVILGSLLPMAIYILFAVIVVGVTGKATTEVATVGLGNVIGPYMIIFGNLFAVFAMGTSFLTKGIIMRELFIYDFKLSKIKSWLLIIIIPLLLFVGGFRDFITTLGIVGGLSIGISGSIIIFLFWKAKKHGDRKPEFSLPKFKIVGSLLLLMFLLGLIYTIWGIFV